MTNSKKRSRVLKRDRRLCGVHLGGCGKPIAQGQKPSLDHIIPKALFSRLATGRRAEFGKDWNLQPMHISCNNISKGSQLEEWPRFSCKCHYLQIRKGNMYVCTRGSIGKGRYKLADNVVAERDERVDALLVPGFIKHPDGKRVAGYRKGKLGYFLPRFRPSSVEFFNLTERGRVGLEVPRYLYRDERGRVVAKWGSTMSQQ